MDNIFTSTTLANVFKALGAKTSDNNYAIPLFNKTSAIPQGLMDLPTLASVLGVAQYHTYLASGSINDLQTPGTWLVNAQSISDGPIDVKGIAILEVIKLNTVSPHLIQRLTIEENGKIYSRCIKTNGEFSHWST